MSLVGCGLLVRAVGPKFVSNPWNPDITVLPYGLLVLLAWTMTCGDTWALPVAVGVASFCVQTHVGYAPMAIPVLLWGAGVARRARSAGRYDPCAGASRRAGGGSAGGDVVATGDRRAGPLSGEPLPHRPLLRAPRSARPTRLRWAIASSAARSAFRRSGSRVPVLRSGFSATISSHTPRPAGAVRALPGRGLRAVAPPPRRTGCVWYSPCWSHSRSAPCR